MESLVLGAIVSVFAIGFVGGLIGSRLRLGGQSEADAERHRELEQLAARTLSLHAEHQSLRARVAALEAQAKAGAGLAPPLQAAATAWEAPPDVAPPSAEAAREPELDLDLDLDFALEDATSTPRSGEPLEPESAPRNFEPKPAPAGPRRPTHAPPPAEPSWVARWLLGGNTLVRVGIVILFFGVGFLLKYAYERVQVPIELRLSGIALLAMALLAVGWHLREKRPGYAQALQGGGIGVLYLTVFAALRLYGLIPPGLAMLLLIGIAAFSALLALLQNGRSLAFLGTSGGFLAPVLASTGSGSHVMLFTYYALLNAGVLAIALQRAWRELNLAGFVFTFVIGGVWGAKFYRPELFASTEPFLVLFFLMYVAVPILYARHQAVALRAPVDATLVFGTPLTAFGLQIGLVHDFEYGAAFSAAILGGFYLTLASALLKRSAENLRLLVDAFFALGVVFATLAIPLAFEGRWTSAVWALEAAAILWIGVRQQRLTARLFAVLLQLGAGLMFLLDLPHGGLPWLNAAFLGCAMVALAGLFSAAYIERHAESLHASEPAVGQVLLIWGALWWAGAGLLQIGDHVPLLLRTHAALAWFALSSAAFATLARRVQWAGGGALSLAIAPLLLLFAFDAAVSSQGPLASLGYLAWPLGFAAHLYALRLHEGLEPRIAPWLHAAGVWTLAIVSAKALQWGLFAAVPESVAWADVGIGIAPALLLGALCRAAPTRWPLTQERAYLLYGGAPLAAGLALWTFAANWHGEGSADPLPYVPMLNPLDLALLAVLLLIAWWWVKVRRRGLVGDDAPRDRFALAAWGGLSFVVFNGVLLRSLHHWGGVPWDWDAMLASRLVQSALSIFWTLIALGGMVAATRIGARTLWLVGAGLMAVVVAKLFLVDLSNVGGIERVVSFIGVGALMLVVGYFAPVPPKAEISN